MRYLAYAGPHGALDLREYMGTTYNLSGETKEKFQFFSPDYADVPEDARGNVVEVTNEQADELLSFPGHRFVEVPEDRAKVWLRTQANRRAVREAREKIMQPAQPVAAPAPRALHPALAGSVAGEPAALPQIAPMAPRDPETIKAEVRAETQALQKQAKED
jgi:hypothetical protein